MLTVKQRGTIFTDRRLIILVIVLPVALYLWPSMLGGSTTYIMLTGDSMEPTIELGSLVVARPELDYQVGDVIAFIDREDYERQVVHRIVESSYIGYTTKGDNNAQNDSFIVNNSDILGRVIFAVPHLGSVFFFLKSPLGLALVFGTAAIPMLLEKKKPSNNISKKSDRRSSEVRSLFLLAFGVVIGNFVLTQYLIAIGNGSVDSAGLIPDMNPSLESTLMFALYTFVLMLLYYQLKRTSRIQGSNLKQMILEQPIIFLLCITITFFQFHSLVQLLMALVSFL